MRLLVTGAGGMLGKEVVKAVEDRGQQVIPLTHEQLDITDGKMLWDALIEYKPAMVINCAGIVRNRDVSKDAMFAVNAIAPRMMSAHCDELGLRMVQVSTDCVFKGDRIHYERDKANAKDNYGLSKAEGEIRTRGFHLVVRCSFIGIGQRGLLAWLMAQDGQVEGYRNVLWNGLTVKYTAQNIVKLAFWGVDGKVHLYGEDTTKYDVLRMANDALGLNLEIVPVDKPKADYRLRTYHPYEYYLPPLEEQIKELADDHCRCSCRS